MTIKVFLIPFGPQCQNFYLRVFDQVRLKAETSWHIYLHVANLAIILSKHFKIIKAPIMLRGQAGGSAPLLFTGDKIRFARDETRC